jgi:hypothetical protein
MIAGVAYLNTEVRSQKTMTEDHRSLSRGSLDIDYGLITFKENLSNKSLSQSHLSQLPKLS